MKIYLAGKVDATHGAWRDGLLGTRYNFDAHRACPRWELINHGGQFYDLADHSDDMAPHWPKAPNDFVLGIHDYVGPYRTTYADALTKHSGYFHGAEWTGQHGMMDRMHQEAVIRECKEALARADLVFAYINSPDCFATLVEVGMAHAMGKYVHVAVHYSAEWDWSDYWFAELLADSHSDIQEHHANEITVEDCFRDALVQWSGRANAQKTGGNPFTRWHPADLQQAAGQWYRALKTAEQSFLQIYRWTSDPRVRDEAARMVKRIGEAVGA